jgi:hypothetical protein
MIGLGFEFTIVHLKGLAPFKSLVGDDMFYYIFILRSVAVVGVFSA